jgi:membrane protease YdiL (CAAX protease family)
LRGIGHLLNSSGVSRWGVFISSIGGFIHGAGLESYFYVAPILMAPFCEEIFMRGFLYRAFRGTYPVLVSTAILVVISCVMHIDQILQSVF